jgi:hypothetical protein
MFKAVHKLSGEIVWSILLETDATWIGKEKDEWIAPRYMVYDYNEKGDVKVSFIKSYIRDDGVPVSAHFRHESNREIYEGESESKEHKLAKLGVYESICNGDIKIDNQSLKLLLKDIEFEYPISNSKKSKIADVIAIFKEWHPIYGKGIIFEVQFSNQNKEITEDRTFNRIVEGYSVCWLWDNDFDNGKLKLEEHTAETGLSSTVPKPLIIIPFTKAIEEYLEKIKNDKFSKINDAGFLLDKKINILSDKYKEFEVDLANKSAEVIDTVLNGFRYELQEVSAGVKDRLDTIKELIKKEKEHDINFLFKQAMAEINIDIKESLKNKLDEGIFIEDIKNDIRERIINRLNIQTINYFPPNWLKDIIKQVMNEKINDKKLKEELLSQISKQDTNINLDIIHTCLCKKCNVLFPIKSMEFERGSAYCYSCFDSLEDNWKKRSDNKNGGNKVY